MPKPLLTIRAVRQTILVVGQGHVEVAFLKHLRRNWECSIERSITVVNARAQSVDQVMKAALAAYKRRPHDHLVALFSGQPGTSLPIKIAKKPVQLITADPCFEALLLRLHNDVLLRSELEHRIAFIERFGAAADSDSVLAQHFPREFLETRLDLPEMRSLLSLFGS